MKIHVEVYDILFTGNNIFLILFLQETNSSNVTRVQR